MKKIECLSLPLTGRYHDDQLAILARSFADLPPMEYAAGPFGDGFDGLGRAHEKFYAKPTQAKHITKVPHTEFFSVKFIFRQTRVYLANSNEEKLDDLLRIADAFTYLLWPYRERGADYMRESAFNFSIKDTELDLGLWRETRGDVMELLTAVIERLEQLEIIKLPAQRQAERHDANVHSLSRTKSMTGKVASVLARYQELDQLAYEERLLVFQKMFSDYLKELNALREGIFTRLAQLGVVTTAGRDAVTTGCPPCPTFCGHPTETAGRSDT